MQNIKDSDNLYSTDDVEEYDFDNDNSNDDKNKIESKKDIKENHEEIKKNADVKKDSDSRNSIVIAVVLLFFIALGIFAYAYKNPDFKSLFFKNDTSNETILIKYQNHTFFKENGLWVVFITASDGKTKYKVSLHYDPQDVYTIPVIHNGSSIFNSESKYYIAIDPNKKMDQAQNFVLASAELSRNLVSTFGKELVSSCYANYNVTLCSGRPLVDCSVNKTIPIILFNQSSETNINFITPNCVVINGHDENVIKASEKLIYRWLGIFK